MHKHTNATRKAYLSLLTGAICTQGPILQSLQAQNLFGNGSFETGTYPSGSASFAGQVAHGLAGTGGTGPAHSAGVTSGWSIANWTFSSGNNGFVDRWVSDGDTPVMAQGGSKYVYLSTTQVTTGGNACLKYNSDMVFTAGSSYRFSFWAADADSYKNGTKIGIEVKQVGGSFITIANQMKTLSKNSNWENNQESTVPWQLYTVDWIPSATITASVYFSVQSSESDKDANVVLDNVSLTNLSVVPEPQTLAAGLFISTLVGFTWLKRRIAKT